MTIEKDVEEIKKERDGLRKDFEKKLARLKMEIGDFSKFFSEEIYLLKRLMTRGC